MSNSALSFPKGVNMSKVYVVSRHLPPPARFAICVSAVVMVVVSIIKLSIESPVREGVVILLLTLFAVSGALVAIWDGRREAKEPRLVDIPQGLSGTSFFVEDTDEESCKPVH